MFIFIMPYKDNFGIPKIASRLEYYNDQIHQRLLIKQNLYLHLLFIEIPQQMANYGIKYLQTVYKGINGRIPLH